MMPYACVNGTLNLRVNASASAAVSRIAVETACFTLFRHSGGKSGEPVISR